MLPTYCQPLCHHVANLPFRPGFVNVFALCMLVDFFGITENPLFVDYLGVGKLDGKWPLGALISQPQFLDPQRQPPTSPPPLANSRFANPPPALANPPCQLPPCQPPALPLPPCQPYLASPALSTQAERGKTGETKMIKHKKRKKAEGVLGFRGSGVQGFRGLRVSGLRDLGFRISTCHQLAINLPINLPSFENKI